MKKQLVVLFVLALILAVTVPAFADDLKISGWAHYELDRWVPGQGNSINLDDEMQTRLTFFKQISDNFSFTYQFRMLGDYQGAYNYAGNQNEAYYQTYDFNGTTGYGNTNWSAILQTRLAYASVKLSDTTTLTIGDNAYWLLGGMLMDDYVTGVVLNTKLGPAGIQILAGRSSDYTTGAGDVNILASIKNGSVVTNQYGDDNQIYDLEVAVPAGPLNLTFNYETGDNRYAGPYSINDPADYNGPSILGAVIDYPINKNYDLSVGYATNSNVKAENLVTPGDSNSELRVQLGVTGVIPKTGMWLQYWDAGEIDTPTENGDHMMTWWNEYGCGESTGFRIITDTQLGGGVGLGLYYGGYSSTHGNNLLGGGNNAAKYGVELYCSF